MSLAAFGRPFHPRTLLGILLVGIPILELGAMGYKMSCAYTAMQQSYELPHWRNWKTLFTFGLKARLIQMIWFMPALVSFLLLWLKLRTIDPGAALSLQQILQTQNLLLATLALLVIAAIFSPASVMNFVSEGRLSSAFSFTMWRRFFSRHYASAWLVAALYTLLIAAAFLALLIYVVAPASEAGGTLGALVPVIMLPVELLLLFLPSVTVWTLFGEAWGKAIERTSARQQLM